MLYVVVKCCKWNVHLTNIFRLAHPRTSFAASFRDVEWAKNGEVVMRKYEVTGDVIEFR